MVVIWAFVIRCLFCEETPLLMVWNKFWSSILIFVFMSCLETLKLYPCMKIEDTFRPMLWELCIMRMLFQKRFQPILFSIYPTLLFFFLYVYECFRAFSSLQQFQFFKRALSTRKNRDSWKFHMDILKENIFIQNSIYTELLKSIFLTSHANFSASK